MAERFGIPPQLFTQDPDDEDNNARLKVDVGEAGFWDGRQFFVSDEFSIAQGDTRVYKFYSPIDFLILSLRVSIDQGALRVRTYLAGTEGGTFTQLDTYPSNALSTTPSYTQQTVLSSGGTLTPTGGPTNTQRIRTANASGQATLVSISSTQQQGLPASTTYATLENIGTGTCTGVYNATIEERPPGYLDWQRKYI